MDWVKNMAKLMVIPKLKNLHAYESADAFLIGIQDLCVNFETTFTLDELQHAIEENPAKQFFVSVNKNMRNRDLDVLKETLLKLEKMKIQGIFYYDISVVEFKEELHLTKDLVWHQEHLTTNYGTCNYWYSFGAKYSCLSSEITLKEMKEIARHVQGKLIVPVFGYIPMFTSARHVVKNYGTQFHLPIDENIHYLKKEGYTYPIIDNKEGTTVYSSFILDALEETLELQEEPFAYFLLNSFHIPEEPFLVVLNCFKNMTEDNKREMIEKMNALHLPTDKGFLYKETIYKVK